MELEEIKDILLNTLKGCDNDKLKLIKNNPKLYNQYYQYIVDFYSKYPENSYALNNLGYIYQEGNTFGGIKEDYEKAIELYEKAIELGNSHAMNNLAYKYKNGMGVEENYEKAIELYEKAIQLGNTSAMINLGFMYQYGNGVNPDYEKAFELYIMAYNLGDKNSLTRIKNTIEQKPALIFKVLDNSNNAITELNKNINELKDINNQLKETNTELMYFPGGPGYYECKYHFADCLEVNNKN